MVKITQREVSGAGDVVRFAIGQIDCVGRAKKSHERPDSDRPKDDAEWRLEQGL